MEFSSKLWTENFAAASQWCGQQYFSMVELVDYTYDGQACRG